MSRTTARQPGSTATPVDLTTPAENTPAIAGDAEATASGDSPAAAPRAIGPIRPPAPPDPRTADPADQLTEAIALLTRARRYGIHTVGLPAAGWGAIAIDLLTDAEALLRHVKRQLTPYPWRMLPAILGATAATAGGVTALRITGHPLPSLATGLVLGLLVVTATVVLPGRRRQAGSQPHPGWPLAQTTTGANVGTVKTDLVTIAADITAARALVDAVRTSLVHQHVERGIRRPARLLAALARTDALLLYAAAGLHTKRHEL